MAWKRWKTSLYVRPQAWWTPIGLLAVIGPSRKLQRCPPASWVRSRANVRRLAQRASNSCSCATKSGFGLTVWNIGPRLAMNAAGLRHTSEEAGVGSPRARRTEVPSILPAMQQPPQEARPRDRSAFAAAFLSLIFPGLGHAYAGAFERALGFAALPFLALALIAGLALNMGAFVFAGVLIEYLPLVLVANIVLLVYRIVAAIDAYRVVAYLNAVELSGKRFGPPRLGLAPLSLAGLLAVCLVIAGGHGVVAYYGVQAKSTLDCIFDPSGTAEGCDQALGSPEPGSGEGSGAQSAAPTTATPVAPVGSPVPAATTSSWNGTDRLNILLVGADQRPS